MKITEYENLCLYLGEEDKEQFIQEKLAGAIAYKYIPKHNHLIVRYKDHQENWRLRNPEKMSLWSTIGGMGVWELRFLSGKYSSEDIMYAMSRVRLGKYEAEAI